jgi:hypothetical protein
MINFIVNKLSFRPVVKFLGWGSAHHKSAELTGKTRGRTFFLGTEFEAAVMCLLLERYRTGCFNGTQRVFFRISSYESEVYASVPSFSFTRLSCPLSRRSNWRFSWSRVAARAMGRPLHSRPAAYTCLLYAAVLPTAPTYPVWISSLYALAWQSSVSWGRDSIAKANLGLWATGSRQ